MHHRWVMTSRGRRRSLCILSCKHWRWLFLLAQTILAPANHSTILLVARCHVRFTELSSSDPVLRPQRSDSCVPSHCLVYSSLKSTVHSPEIPSLSAHHEDHQLPFQTLQGKPLEKARMVYFTIGFAYCNVPINATTTLSHPPSPAAWPPNTRLG